MLKRRLLSPTVTLILAVWMTFLHPASAQDFELSYLLVRAKDHQVLQAQEADKLRTPASALKIVTAVAALETLGVEHRFETRLQSTAKLTGGVLQGDLMLAGSGDPELDEEALLALVAQLKERGVKTVRGNLIVDPGALSFPLYGSGWAWDDAGSSYSPEVTGLNLNGGVWPLSPEGVEVRQEEEEGFWLVPGREGVVAVGELPNRYAPPRTALKTGQFFRTLLAAQGILLKGEVKHGRSEGQVLAVHRSRPLQSLLQEALKWSDNLAMELFYRASSRARPACLEDAQLRIADGSGLSRYNLISADLLVKVLQENGALKTLLAKPGEGTLRNRFQHGLSAQHIVAKTGTLGNVSALVGYLFADTDKECVFAILINGHLGSTAERKALEDELVERWVTEIGYPYMVD